MQVHSSAAEGGFVNPSGQQPQQPFFVSTAPVVRLNHRQAAAAGVVLIIIACLSILSNAIELAISTGAPRPDYSYSHYSQYYYRTTTDFFDRRADDIRGMAFQSTGFVGHGFWCGIMVSMSTDTSTPALQSGSRGLYSVISLKGHSGAELHIHFPVHLESIYYQRLFYSIIALLRNNCKVFVFVYCDGNQCEVCGFG